MNPARTVQLDLFAGDPEARRVADGLTCLRDAVPDAMNVLVHLRFWMSRDDRHIGASGDWAYGVRRDGLRYEHEREWWHGARRRGERYGWDRTPTQIVTWDELAAHLGDDPRRPSVVAWAESLTAPDRWRDLSRPYELWPARGGWNPDYVRSDHARDGWAERIAAWRTLKEICTDAITAVEAS